MRNFFNDLFNLKAYSKELKFIVPRDKYGRKYSTFNPTIIVTQDGYIIICRIANYVITDTGYELLNDDKHIKTTNIMLYMDKKFKFKGQKQINGYSPIYPKFNAGLEDCRLVSHKNEIYFTATCFELDESNIARIALCKLNNNDIEEIRLIPEVSKGRPEKNWMPIVLKNELMFIYYVDPLIIVNKNGEIVHRESFNKFPNMRGGAAMFYNNGILVIGHEVDIKNNYYHRFVYYDNNLKLTKASKLFYFVDIGIEFVCGICISHDDKIIITSGINDNRAFAFEISRKYLESILLNA